MLSLGYSEVRTNVCYKMTDIELVGDLSVGKCDVDVTGKCQKN